MLYAELFDQVMTQLDHYVAELKDAEDHLVELALPYRITKATNHGMFLEKICKARKMMLKI